MPAATLNDDAAKRLDIDRAQHQRHLDMLNAAGDLSEKLSQIFTPKPFDPVADPDASLYSGGFFSDNDKRKMELIRSAEPDMLKTLSIPFEDSRLAEMLFRYRARNWPGSLTEDEQDQWLQYRQQRLADETPDAILNFSRFYSALAEAKQQDLPEQKQKVLADLTHYASQLAAELGYQAN